MSKATELGTLGGQVQGVVMPIASYLLCLLAGAFAFAMVMHLVAGLGRDGRRDARSLMMAGMCALSAAFNLTVLLTIRETDLHTAMLWNKVGMACIGVTPLLLLAFLDKSVGLIPRAAWIILVALAVGLTTLNLALPFGLQYTQTLPPGILYLPWGEAVHAPMGVINPLLPIGSIWVVATSMACSWVQWRRYQDTRSVSDALVLAATAGMITTTVIGTLSRFGLLDLHFAGILGLALTVLVISSVHVHEHRLQREREALERIRHAERIGWLAMHDPETGLPNQTGLEDWVAKRVPEDTATLALLGVDHLGRINEAFGHRTGDAIVHALARLTRVAAGTNGFVARLTGDKFVVVMEGDASSSALDGLLDAVRTAIDLNDGLVIEASMSGGVTRLPPGHSGLAAALQEAESALITAKERGRGRWTSFDRHAFDRDLRWTQLASAMREGLRRGEFRLVYQPRLYLADGATSGFEALMRWNPPDGPVSPGEFIQIAEESGFILDLGRWAIDTALAQRTKWLDAGLSPGRMAINLSPRQLADAGLADFIADRLRHHGHRAEDVEFEVTESVAMDQVDVVLPVLQSLAEEGFHLAMDDFGTGHSSLSRLQELPFDVIKVDLSFVRRLGTPQGDELMSTVLGLIRALGRHAVAEGIETAPQRDWLRDAGCREVQGFLFSRPLEPEDAAEWIRRHGPAEVRT